MGCHCSTRTLRRWRRKETMEEGKREGGSQCPSSLVSFRSTHTTNLTFSFASFVLWGYTSFDDDFFFFFFLIANEICEKLAVVGFSTNMINYLTTQLHMPVTKAANTLTNFGGTSSLTPLLGAFISDAFIGRFWTITVASIVYQIVKTLSLSLSL